MENKNLTAAKGLKLIRTAQILSIIATVAAIVGTIAALSGAMVAGGSAMEDEALAMGAIGVAGIGGLMAIAGLVIALVSFVMQLVGLSKAGPAHAGYKNAMLMVAINIALGVVAFFVMGNQILSVVFQVASPIAVFLSVYFVLSATIVLLREKGDEANAAKGSTVRIMYLACTAVGVLNTLIGACPVLTGVASIATMISSVVQIVAMFLYIGFLGRSVRALSQ